MHIYIYVYIYIYIYICMYVCIHTYIYVRYSRKKQIFIENVLATAFINSFLSTSNFSLMIHFKTNLHVIIYIIYINEPLNF